MEKLIFGN
jgi:hypothetical protein